MYITLRWTLGKVCYCQYEWRSRRRNNSGESIPCQVSRFLLRFGFAFTFLCHSFAFSIHIMCISRRRRTKRDLQKIYGASLQLTNEHSYRLSDIDLASLCRFDNSFVPKMATETPSLVCHIPYMNMYYIMSSLQKSLTFSNSVK